MLEQKLYIPKEAISRFSKDWHICELALFGSVLRDDFGLASDVDILVTFDSTAQWGLFAHLQMQQELATLIGRPVDLVSRRALEQSNNWLRREHILRSAQTIYSVSNAL